MGNTLVLHALAWHDAGACVIPAATDGSKAPGVSTWRQYIQGEERPSREQVASWVAGVDGFGLVCGAISGNLEMLEFEGRAVAANLPAAFADMLTDHGHQELWQRLVDHYVETTPSGGLHFLYRVDGPARRNTKLARRPATAEELAAKPEEKIKTLLETRGEGGYVIVAPSAGRTHETGQAWTVHHGGPGQVAVVSEEERDVLHAVATLLDEMPAADPARTTNPVAGTFGGNTDRPGDDYNARADWSDILEPHGWTRARRMGRGWTWRRPGKDRGISATTGQASDGVDRLFVFSTSTHFDTETPYSKFGAYALLDHGGDHAAAARALRKAGYGASTDTPPSVDRDAQSLEQLAAGGSPPTTPADAPTAPPEAEEKEFWQARPILDHVRRCAVARRCSPWALLGVTLARVITAVPPFVVLPPLIGGDASLNLFVGLVGESGSGKGAAESAATHVLDVGDVETAGVGSGEGIAHLFCKRTKEGVDQHTTSVLFTVAEIDTLSALGDRRGATLLPELRKAWSGERLGFGYADPLKRLPVHAHKYRLCLVAGIQPGRAQALLSDIDGGTPQRFLWLPATDPDAPDVAPEAPTTRSWARPAWPTASTRTYRSVLDVCETARTEIDTERVKRLRGIDGALDGHGQLTRLKTAAALAILDQRAEVAEEDWQLAGVVTGVSDRTRGAVQVRLADAERKHNEAIGRSEGIRQVVAAEHVSEAAIRRICKTVMRRLQREGGEWVGKSVLRQSIAGRDRKYYDDALQRLVDAGQIEVRQIERSGTGHGGSGWQYRLVTGR